MTKKLHTLESLNLQSPAIKVNDCGFGYAPRWSAKNVKHRVK